MAKKAAKKKTAQKTNSSKRYSFLDDVRDRVLEIAEASKTGEVKIKRSDMKGVLDAAFENAAVQAARGERVRFPVIGTLVRKDVVAVKGGTKYLDPFTKEEKIRKARPASKKPRWSFPKSAKEIFGMKKYW